MTKKSLELLMLSVMATTASCGDFPVTRLEYSDIKKERGVVVDTYHTDAHSHSEITMSPSFDMDGNASLSLGSSTTSLPETWGVYFRCEHNTKFPIDGSEQRHKELWEKLDPGMDVTITYREQYKNTYEDRDHNGERELVNRELVDFDFLDANPLE